MILIHMWVSICWLPCQILKYSILTFLLCRFDRLFDGNQLTGPIPSSLGLVKHLEVLWVENRSPICLSGCLLSIIFLTLIRRGFSLAHVTADLTGTSYQERSPQSSAISRASLNCQLYLFTKFHNAVPPLITYCLLLGFYWECFFTPRYYFLTGT